LGAGERSTDTPAPPIRSTKERSTNFEVQL